MVSLNAADRALQMAVDDQFDGLNYDTVTYRPRSGATRSISAVIDWPPAEEFLDIMSGQRPIIDIYVSNNSSSGISAAEIDLGGDKIDVPQRHGLASITARIVAIVAQDRTLLHIRGQ